jgi:hypothetical protein
MQHYNQRSAPIFTRNWVTDKYQGTRRTTPHSTTRADTTQKRPNTFWFSVETSPFYFQKLIKYEYIRGGADKSLARPRMKQATATKLGIYSTYFPRSSIHFLASCSNFPKPHEKKIRILLVQPGLRDSNDLRLVRKIATFQLFFSPGNR